MPKDIVATSAPLADLASEVELSAPTLLARGYRAYERFEVAIAGKGDRSTQIRDVLRGGKVAAVLPVDPVHDRIVVIRQFRLAAHLANGKGNLVEIVAGRVEPNETPAEAARRECAEEIGVGPAPLIELFAYLTTPGICDEEITLFLGAVDSSQILVRGGAPSEGEVTQPLAVSIDSALAALGAGTLRNGPLIIALQWLAINRCRIHDILRAGAAGF